MRLALRGRVEALTAEERRALLGRGSGGNGAPPGEVAAMLGRVRAEGDAALRDFARRFDRVELERLEVPAGRLRAALEGTPRPLRAALERAFENLLTTHDAAVPRASVSSPEAGIRVERRPEPLALAGIYAPGGRAAYASSVLMAAAPARAAGVGEVILCSPPGRSGEPAEVVLAAAAVAGVERVFALGGAGAVGALAYGTESVPRADVVVGPGNAWVAEAKRQVAGEVGIDAPAGPSELLVIADGSAGAERVAGEAVAQAEHDADAAVVILCLPGLEAGAVEEALRAAAEGAARREVVLASLAARCALLECGDVDAALSLSADYAPEHLLLAVADADSLLPRVRSAGAVFLGISSSVVFGDYAAGGNHVLPTGGAARAFSALGPEAFVRWSWIQRVEPAAAARLSADVALLAEAEGLPAHAAAARAWGGAS
jgi:histidinol dehydrogenase